MFRITYPEDRVYFFAMTAGMVTPKLVADASKPPTDESDAPLMTLADAVKVSGRDEAELISLWKSSFQFIPEDISLPAEPNAGDNKPWWETQPENMREAIARKHLYPHLSDELFTIFKNECAKRAIDPASRYIIPRIRANSLCDASPDPLARNNGNGNGQSTWKIESRDVRGYLPNSDCSMRVNQSFLADTFAHGSFPVIRNPPAFNAALADLR